MVSAAEALAGAARHGRHLLVLGLVLGLALPPLAQLMRPWLPAFVTVLLFLAAFRIGPRQALGSLRALPQTLGLVLALQLALPLALIALFAPTLGLTHPLATVLVLMAAAPSISGAPHLAVMLGKPPAAGLRLLIAGTVLMPLTVLPVFWSLPALGSLAEVLGATLRLVVTICVAVAAAFLARALVRRAPDAGTIGALDGIAAIALCLMVTGLMTAVGPALRSMPVAFALWLLAATAANFGLQIVCFHLLRARGWGADATVAAIAAGNRNVALYLVALPAAATDPLLLFIGCYQVPMFLTPLMLRRLYR